MLPKRFPPPGWTPRTRLATIADEVVDVAPGAYLEGGDGAEETRTAAGRVLGRRDLGGAAFLDLVDRDGRLQLAFLQKSVARSLNVNLGDIIGVRGVPGRTRRGEPTLFVTEAPIVLARIQTPLPDTFHGVTDVEARYRRRYVDLLMNDTTRATFLARSKMVAEIRRYMDGHGFVEVETPVLQPRYGGAFARPFTTHHNELDQDLYLRIATELYLKRLIVGGLEKVYEIGRVFRNEGVSYKHNPEFTMLEWYEAFVDYRDTMDRFEELIETVALATNGTTTTAYRGHEIDLKRPWKRIKFADALAEHGVWSTDPDALRAILEGRGIDTAHDKTWSQLVDHALTAYVEPRLIQPTFLYDYPVELSPFARLTDHDDRTVERFEGYVGGTEVCNAFSELNDAEEQAARFAMQAREGVGGNSEAEPGDPDYVEALTYGMPPTGGLGFGIDRLAMVLTGNDSVRDVVLFPALRRRD